MNTGVLPVAKKKSPVAKAEPTEERVVIAQPTEERVVIAHLKGSPEYAEWLDSLHKQTHIPKAALFRLAMAEYAKANGHEAPPER